VLPPDEEDVPGACGRQPHDRRAVPSQPGDDRALVAFDEGDPHRRRGERPDHAAQAEVELPGEGVREGPRLDDRMQAGHRNAPLRPVDGAPEIRELRGPSLRIPRLVAQPDGT
jgi:hypothetical protein